MGEPFTPEEDERLAALYAQGLSDTVIARWLREEGFPARSRNSLIGRRHLKGLMGPARVRASRPVKKVERRALAQPVAARAPKVARERADTVPAFEVAPVFEAAPAGALPPDRAGIAFIGAPDEACRFPLWADDARPSVDAMRICGEPVRPGQPYCRACCALAYVAPDPAKLRARKAAREHREQQRRAAQWSAA